MTLTSTTVKARYSGDGSTTSFVVPFIFWDDDDLKVILTDANGVETVWTRGTQYTVTGGNGSTGTVEVVTSPNDNTPASGETLTIKSNRSNLQDTSLPVGGPLPSASIEQELDQIVRLIQQATEKLDRALVMKEGSAFSDVIVPDPEAGKVLRWDSDGDDLENATATDGSSLTLPLPVVDGGTGAANAADARDNLGLTGTSAAIALAKFHHGGL